MDQRVEVKLVNSRNIDDWLNTVLRHRLVDRNGQFRQLNAISHDLIPHLVHQFMEFLRNNSGEKPVWGEMYLIAEDDEHGGIPVEGKTDTVLMDILAVLENNNKDNLRRHGDGAGERTRHYVANTILHRSIPEDELITIWDKVDVRSTYTDLLDRQFFYATCRMVAASFLLWKEITTLFTPLSYYLFTPNLLKLLTFLDQDEYVRNHRQNQDYYCKHWDGDVRLSQEKIEHIFKHGFSKFSPLFKLVHFELDKFGKCHIFFQKIEPSFSGRGDWLWANFMIVTMINMCISSLGWVSSSGIAPVQIKRDPATNEGYVDDEVTGGHVIASLCGHKYTNGDKHANCEYRIVRDRNGDFVYPGYNNLVPRRDAQLDTWAGLTQRLQGLGVDLIMKGLNNDMEVASLEALINKLESRIS